MSSAGKTNAPEIERLTCAQAEWMMTRIAGGGELLDAEWRALEEHVRGCDHEPMEPGEIPVAGESLSSPPTLSLHRGERSPSPAEETPADFDDRIGVVAGAQLPNLGPTAVVNRSDFASATAGVSSFQFHDLQEVAFGEWVACVEDEARDAFEIAYGVGDVGAVAPWHRHVGEELMYILSGRARFRTAQALTVELGPGELLWHRSEVPHQLEALAGPTRVLFAYHSPFGRRLVRASAHRAWGLDDEAAGAIAWSTKGQAITAAVGARVASYRKWARLDRHDLSVAAGVDLAKLTALEWGADDLYAELFPLCARLAPYLRCQRGDLTVPIRSPLVAYGPAREQGGWQPGPSGEHYHPRAFAARQVMDTGGFGWWPSMNNVFLGVRRMGFGPSSECEVQLASHEGREAWYALSGQFETFWCDKHSSHGERGVEESTAQLERDGFDVRRSVVHGPGETSANGFGDLLVLDSELFHGFRGMPGVEEPVALHLRVINRYPLRRPASTTLARQSTSRRSNLGTRK